ncbi:hypothetical protein LSTR_LSTR002934 [Laodelphax striatellus]|uniref:Uncharacterized protein n=1 Tax=Laodelphax striatellus TaxID=195883 RepID=A0A482XLA7_LAOST|nr:hypothetical protein LSTR_LSTR002934 [Laodelphax striatellus]
MTFGLLLLTDHQDWRTLVPAAIKFQKQQISGVRLPGSGNSLKTPFSRSHMIVTLFRDLKHQSSEDRCLQLSCAWKLCTPRS